MRQHLPRWFLRALGTPGTVALQKFHSSIDDVRSLAKETSKLSCVEPLSLAPHATRVLIETMSLSIATD